MRKKWRKKADLPVKGEFAARLIKGGSGGVSDANAVFLLLQWWFWHEYQDPEGFDAKAFQKLREALVAKLAAAFWQRKRARIAGSYPDGQLPVGLPNGQGTTDRHSEHPSEPADWASLLEQAEEATKPSPPDSSDEEP